MTMVPRASGGGAGGLAAETALARLAKNKPRMAALKAPNRPRREQGWLIGVPFKSGSSTGPENQSRALGQIGPSNGRPQQPQQDAAYRDSTPSSDFGCCGGSV